MASSPATTRAPMTKRFTAGIRRIARGRRARGTPDPVEDGRAQLSRRRMTLAGSNTPLHHCWPTIHAALTRTHAASVSDRILAWDGACTRRNLLTVFQGEWCYASYAFTYAFMVGVSQSAETRVTLAWPASSTVP